MDWEEGRDLRLSDVTLEGAAYGLTGDAVVTTQRGSPNHRRARPRFAPNVWPSFSGLAEAHRLGGAANLDLTFQAAPWQGTFDITAKGSGQDISLGRSPRRRRVWPARRRLDFVRRGTKTGWAWC